MLKTFPSDKPAVTVEERPALYSSGEEVALICTTDGNPLPKITWVFKGTIIADNTNKNNGSNEEEIYKLMKLGGNISSDDIQSSTHSAMENHSNISTGEPSIRGNKLNPELVYKITQLDVRHLGVYKCIAENSEGISTELLVISIRGE